MPKATVSLASVPRVLRPTVQAAVGRGWLLEKTKRHLRLRKPGVGIVVFPVSPSDSQVVRLVESDLRRAERGA